MNKKDSTAYIDASNLKFGIQQSNWELDYKAFRSWLRDKFSVSKAVLFMGLIPSNFELYNYLQSIGYDIIFKPTTTNKDGKTKGNVDGELILYVAKDFYENKLESAVLVAGDGDYHCIIEFLKEKKVSVFIVSPNKKYLSFLLKHTNVPIIVLDDFVEKLMIKTKKPPNMP